MTMKSNGVHDCDIKRLCDIKWHQMTMNSNGVNDCDIKRLTSNDDNDSKWRQ